MFIKNTLLAFSFLFLNQGAIAQLESKEYSREEVVKSIVHQLYENQKDSAGLIYKKYQLENKALFQIIRKEQPSNQELLAFMVSIQKTPKIDFKRLCDYVIQKILIPETNQELDMAYVELMFNLISNYRNNNNLDQAVKLNKGLETYVLEHDTSKKEVNRAWQYTLINDMVLFHIQKDTMMSKKLGLQYLKNVAALKDTNLLVLGWQNIYNLYTLQRDVEKATHAINEAIRLDEELAVKTSHYYENLSKLVELNIFFERNPEQTKRMLSKIYQNDESRLISFEMFARYFMNIKSNEDEKQALFNLLDVKDIVDFKNKALAETEGFLYDYDQFYLYQVLADLMESYGELKISNGLMVKAISLNRKIYSQDLSASLADQKSNLIRKEKELELSLEHEKSNRYIASLIFISTLLSFVLLSWFRMKKQKKIVEQKNKKIEAQNREIEKREHEKGLLLKEVHHRVKNNFQIISSLLEMQSKGIEDHKARELALEGKNRVKSMALIHQRLYENDDLNIDFADYTSKLVREISNLYAGELDPQVELFIDKISLDIDTAIPLGLIINELLTNAFKYGVLSDSDIISLKLIKRENDYVLNVKDSGRGIPQEIDINKVKSMGLRLVRTLTKQLQGKFHYTYNKGANFEITFKDANQRTEIA